MRSEQVTIDCLQYCNWSAAIFDQMAQSGVDAVHVTICYHEDFGETVHNLETRNRRFQDNSDRIMPGRVAEDVLTARAAGKTAIFCWISELLANRGWHRSGGNFPPAGRTLFFTKLSHFRKLESSNRFLNFTAAGLAS